MPALRSEARPDHKNIHVDKECYPQYREDVMNVSTMLIHKYTETEGHPPRFNQENTYERLSRLADKLPNCKVVDDQTGNDHDVRIDIYGQAVKTTTLEQAKNHADIHTGIRSDLVNAVLPDTQLRYSNTRRITSMHRIKEKSVSASHFLTSLKALDDLLTETLNTARTAEQDDKVRNNLGPFIPHYVAHALIPTRNINENKPYESFEFLVSNEQV